MTKLYVEIQWKTHPDKSYRNWVYFLLFNDAEVSTVKSMRLYYYPMVGSLDHTFIGPKFYSRKKFINYAKIMSSLFG